MSISIAIETVVLDTEVSTGVAIGIGVVGTEVPIDIIIGIVLSILLFADTPSLKLQLVVVVIV